MKQEEPPSSTVARHYVDWDAVVKTAKANPGTWYNVGTFSPGIAHHIRRGGYRQFINEDDATPALAQMRQHWEITSRTVKTAPRRSDLYVRYLG